MLIGATVRLPVGVFPPPVGVPPEVEFIFAVTQATLSAQDMRRAAANQNTCGRDRFVNRMRESIGDAVPLVCRRFPRVKTS
jgi:hypothetical protein